MTTSYTKFGKPSRIDKGQGEYMEGNKTHTLEKILILWKQSIEIEI